MIIKIIKTAFQLNTDTIGDGLTALELVYFLVYICYFIVIVTVTLFYSSTVRFESPFFRPL